MFPCPEASPSPWELWAEWIRVVCPCSWFIIPKGRKAWVQKVGQPCVDADLVSRRRKTEIGPFHEMEKLELNFLSASPFFNSRKQLAQSFSATNSGPFLCLPSLFQRLIWIAVPLATTAGGDQGGSRWTSGLSPVCSSQVFSLLGKRISPPFEFISPVLFLKGFEMSDKTTNNAAR